jgi:hypothetical protein
LYLSGYSSGCSANLGESFYSFDGANWNDLTTADPTANFCIKALVTAGDDDDDAYEENDTIGNAYPLDSWMFLPHGLGQQHDLDVYEIEIPANNRLVALLKHEHAEGNLGLALATGSGSVIETANTSTDHEWMTAVSGSGGTYYLGVYGPNLGTSYDLLYAVLPQGTSANQESHDSLIAAGIDDSQDLTNLGADFSELATASLGTNSTPEIMPFATDEQKQLLNTLIAQEDTLGNQFPALIA